MGYTGEMVVDTVMWICFIHFPSPSRGELHVKVKEMLTMGLGRKGSLSGLTILSFEVFNSNSSHPNSILPLSTSPQNKHPFNTKKLVHMIPSIHCMHPLPLNYINPPLGCHSNLIHLPLPHLCILPLFTCTLSHAQLPRLHNLMLTLLYSIVLYT